MLKPWKQTWIVRSKYIITILKISKNVSQNYLCIWRATYFLSWHCIKLIVILNPIVIMFFPKCLPRNQTIFMLSVEKNKLYIFLIVQLEAHTHTYTQPLCWFSVNTKICLIANIGNQHVILICNHISLTNMYFISRPINCH